MSTVPAKYLDQQLLRQVFIHNLDRLYFGKCYLNGQLQKLILQASFNTLKLGIQEFASDIKKQIIRYHEIYKLIGEAPSDVNCNPLKSIIKDNFCLDDIQSMSIITDTDIILYIQMMEHINVSATGMLQKIAKSLNYTEVHQLLTECADESLDNHNLFDLISTEYINLA